MQAARKITPTASTPAPHREHGRVLVVDDNQLLRESLSRRLGRRGFAVEGVASVREATELARGRDFEVVLLDMSLPDGNGLDLLRRLRTLYPDVPVVLFTGRIDPQAPLSALQGGAFAYLEKPLNLGKLTTILFDAVRQHRTRDRERQQLERMLGRAYARERRSSAVYLRAAGR